ncbi:MAG: hypothetical protein ACRCT7_17845, partial [Shewanella sp.]
MAKLYQLLLFITFAIGILAQFWLQKNQLTVSASQHQTEFVQLVHQYKDYQGDGQQLFATINAIQPLQFFQYITDLNPQQNYTFGELHQSQHWLQHLLPVKITQDIQLPNARLQLSADTRSWYGVIETNIMTQTLMLLAMYLFLVISLLWLQSR